MTTRFKLTVEYDGRPFAGWQRQNNAPSVQAALEDAVFAFSGETRSVTGAGRTDAGVHALGQVAHFDLDYPITPEHLMGALNAHLRPLPISVLAAEEAASDFDARRSAVERSYLYRIINRRAPLALEAGRAWNVHVPLDAGAMHDAAQMLVGKHDFTSFRASECQAKSPIRTMDELRVERIGDEIRLHARARSFLHHQIRNIIGTLALVGMDKWTADDVKAALESRDRAAAGPTAPPDGLYFVGVRY